MMETAIQKIEKVNAARLVEVKNGKVVTTSLEVAKYFNKEHYHVLRAIRQVAEGLANFGEAPKAYFELGSYVHPQNGQTQPMYYMDRDGFTLLAMGFTGRVALEFKIAYIEAFNKMEAALREGEAGLALSREISDFVRNMRTHVERRLREDPKFAVGNEAQMGFFDNPNVPFEIRLHDIFTQVGNGYRECWEYIRMERRWREKCRYIEDCLDDMWGDICRRKLEGF